MYGELNLTKLERNFDLRYHMQSTYVDQVTEGIILTIADSSFVYIPHQISTDKSTVLDLNSVTTFVNDISVRGLSPTGLVRYCAANEPFFELPKLEQLRLRVFPDSSSSTIFNIHLEGVYDNQFDCFNLESSDYFMALNWPKFTEN